jgi:LPS sulfotransferase NodH
MTSEQKRFLLITCPRTASNLLLKLLALETHENVVITPQGGGPQGGNGYFFIRNQMLKGQMGTHGKNMSEWTEYQRVQLKESTQSCYEDLEAYSKKAEAKGKIAFVKEHVHFITEPTAQEEFLFGDTGTEKSPLTVQTSDQLWS